MTDEAHVLDYATRVAGMRKNGSINRSTLTVSRASLPIIVVLSLLLLGRPSHATTFTELGDAGNLPGTAQVMSGIGLLTEIHGTLSPANGDGQDMYRLYIDGSGTFSATTVGGVGFDSQLFLFDTSGKGVYANDDVRFRDFAPSTLPAGDPLTPIATGYYYLAITQCCSTPISASGQIFTVAGPNHRALSGPTGVGGDLPVTGYLGAFSQFPALGGPYQIFLSGAHLTDAHLAAPPASVVPEPHTFTLMLAGLGMMGLCAHRRKTNSNQASSI